MRVLERPFDSVIAPEGRVTVDLMDERGLKIVHRERADNAILNHWLENVKRGVRGESTWQGLPYGNYNLHGGGVLLNSDTDINVTEVPNLSWWTAGVQRGNPLWGWQTYNCLQASYRNIILSDSTEAVDADEMFFPGTVNAFCYLPEAYAPSTNTKRAQMVTSLSFRTPTALRYVAEWGTGYGNGLHNSVGMGMVTWPVGTGLAFAMPSLYANFPVLTVADTSIPAGQSGVWRMPQAGLHTFFGLNSQVINTNIPHQSGHWVSNSEMWVLVSGVGANNLTKLDLSACTVRPFSVTAAASSGLSVTGPTMTTIGAGTNRCGVAVIGTDLWLAYGTTLKRCAKPTNTTLSVTNTYTPAGVGTLVDITTDGTSLYWLDATKVWVINATTGAVTTSWNHGLTGTMHNITYFPAPASKPRLYISYEATALTAGVYNSNPATARNPIVCAAFTTAGVGEQSVAYCANSSGAASVSYFEAGLTMPMSADCKHSIGFWNNNGSAGTIGNSILGPSHMSRTVLGSPITKTSANSMRVTYEFGF